MTGSRCLAAFFVATNNTKGVLNVPLKVSKEEKEQQFFFNNKCNNKNFELKSTFDFCSYVNFCTAN